MLTSTRCTARTKRMPAISRAPWPGTSCSGCRRREAGAASQRDEIALFHSDHARGRAQPQACTRVPVQEPCARPQLEGGMRGIAQRRRWNGVRSTKAARTKWGADRARITLASAAFLLCCVQVAGGAAAFSSRTCDTSGSASVVTGTSACGVKVSLYYPGTEANVSRPFSASSGNLRLGFAVSEPVPNNAKVTMLLPAQSDGFKFDYGGTTMLEPIVTAGGDEPNEAVHGTGMPTFTVQPQMDSGGVKTGDLVTISFGEMGAPTVADAEAGYEFDLTHVRNPYANAGLPAANVVVALFFPNGTEWYTEQTPLPEFIANNLSASDVRFELVNPAAGSQTDILVTLTTKGWIPTDGRIEVILPAGFILTFGSTVATTQTNFGEEHAIYVSSVSEQERKITLLMAGSLGFAVSPLPPLVQASFLLTQIRNPFSGLTGYFQVSTLSGNNDVIDQGTSLPGIQVGRGALKKVVVSATDDAARQVSEYSFTMTTTGTVPGNGKFRIVLPFGYFLFDPQLIGYNGLGRTGIPTLSHSGLTLIIQLGGLANSTEALDATEGVSFTIGGIVNPGAGSASTYTVQSTFFDASKVIDEAIVPTIGIVTGMFPSRSISISENRAGKTTVITVNVGTTGYIPDDARLRVMLPGGLAASLPSTSTIESSTCCENANCYSPCNITVHSIVGNAVTVKLGGIGSRNLALGSNISFTVGNVRNLWAGSKDGFDLTLLLSDDISTVMQAMDVDGPLILASNFLSVDVQFSESGATFGNAVSGRCGLYRVKIQLNGILPEYATFKVTFPESIQLNDVWCDFIDDTYTQPITRLTRNRQPLQYILSTDARKRTAVTQVTAPGRSDSWAEPQYVEMYFVNLRHTRAGPLEDFQIEALFPDAISVVERNLSIPMPPVIAESSRFDGELKMSVTPQSKNAGVRTTMLVNVETRGRLPRTGIVEVKFPPSFRIDDGDDTRVLSSTLNGTESDMQVVFSDASQGIVHVQISQLLPTPERPDGLTNSTLQCREATADYSTCVRTPTDVTPGALLMGHRDRTTLPGFVRAKFSFALSQIRNLAGGFSGDFAVNTYLADGTSLNEANPDVPGATLIIGSLAEATVKPALRGSATRTTVDVMVSISNTLQANGNVIVVFPPRYDIDDGSPSNVTDASLVRFTQEYSTPAKVIASDKNARSITVAVGGREDDFLAAFNRIKFTLTNIRNMVARPAPGEPSELSGEFEVFTQLASGATVETIQVEGVYISPNVIESFPVGDGEVLLESRIRGTGNSLTVKYSSDSVLPEDGVVVLGFPGAYTFNVGGLSAATVTYDGIDDTSSFRTLNLNSDDVVGNTTQVRLERLNGTFAVTPGKIIAIRIDRIRVADAVLPTGEHNISVQTRDGATIAQGVLPDVDVGRPSEPLNVFLSNCKANWPSPDPLCVEVTWDKPTDNAGSDIVKYKIAFAVSSIRFEDVVQDIEVDADVGGDTLSGGLPLKQQSIRLNEGSIYYVRVRAGTMNGGVLGFGKAGFGNAVRAVSLPGPPRATLLRSDTTRRLYAAWFQPQVTGALNPSVPILNYKVEFSRFDPDFTNLGPNDTSIVDGSARSLSSSLLQTGRYYARVFASNMAGYGEPSVYTMTALATPIVPVAWDEQVTPAADSVQQIQVGYTLTISIRAFDGDITDEVNVMVDSDQGMYAYLYLVICVHLTPFSRLLRCLLLLQCMRACGCFFLKSVCSCCSLYLQAFRSKPN